MTPSIRTITPPLLLSLAVAVATAASCGQTVVNGHCWNADGDATCAQLYGDGYFCSLADPECEGHGQAHGCVQARPEQDACYSPDGGQTNCADDPSPGCSEELGDETGDEVGETGSDEESESTDTGSTDTGSTDTGSTDTGSTEEETGSTDTESEDTEGESESIGDTSSDTEGEDTASTETGEELCGNGVLDDDEECDVAVDPDICTDDCIFDIAVGDEALRNNEFIADNQDAIAELRIMCPSPTFAPIVIRDTMNYRFLMFNIDDMTIEWSYSFTNNGFRLDKANLSIADINGQKTAIVGATYKPPAPDTTHAHAFPISSDPGLHYNVTLPSDLTSINSLSLQTVNQLIELTLVGSVGSHPRWLTAQLEDLQNLEDNSALLSIEELGLSTLDHVSSRVENSQFDAWACGTGSKKLLHVAPGQAQSFLVGTEHQCQAMTVGSEGIYFIETKNNSPANDYLLATHFDPDALPASAVQLLSTGEEGGANGLVVLDGRIIIAGFTNTDDGESARLSWLTTGGDLIGHHPLPPPPQGSRTRLYDIASCGNGTAIAVGWATIGNDTQKKLWVVKLNLQPEP